MDRPQRFALFLAGLERAPAAHDERSARDLLAEILNAIEDAHSGVGFDPERWMTHDRMYPPQDDYERRTAVAGAALFHARRHRIWFGDNGAIRIVVRTGPDRGRVTLDKPGADGAMCPEEAV